MIAIDTSIILAIMLREPEADKFRTVLRNDALLVGWPTLFETRIVLAAKGFSDRSVVYRDLKARSLGKCRKKVIS